MASPETIELMRRFGMLCEDPDCTATHVDIETVSDEPLFIETL